MKQNLRIRILEVIYLSLLVAGILSAGFWISTGFDLHSPWLIGVSGIVVNRILIFANYFILDVLQKKRQINYRQPLLVSEADNRP